MVSQVYQCKVLCDGIAKNTYVVYFVRFMIWHHIQLIRKRKNSPAGVIFFVTSKLLFDIDLLFSRSGRSSFFESNKREDFPLLEVTAETGLRYGLYKEHFRYSF